MNVGLHSNLAGRGTIGEPSPTPTPHTFALIIIPTKTISLFDVGELARTGTDALADKVTPDRGTLGRRMQLDAKRTPASVGSWRGRSITATNDIIEHHITDVIAKDRKARANRHRNLLYGKEGGPQEEDAYPPPETT